MTVCVHRGIDWWSRWMRPLVPKHAILLDKLPFCHRSASSHAFRNKISKIFYCVWVWGTARSHGDQGPIPEMIRCSGCYYFLTVDQWDGKGSLGHCHVESSMGVGRSPKILSTDVSRFWSSVSAYALVVMVWSKTLVPPPNAIHVFGYE